MQHFRYAHHVCTRVATCTRTYTYTYTCACTYTYTSYTYFSASGLCQPRRHRIDDASRAGRRTGSRQRAQQHFRRARRNVVIAVNNSKNSNNCNTNSKSHIYVCIYIYIYIYMCMSTSSRGLCLLLGGRLPARHLIHS